MIVTIGSAAIRGCSFFILLLLSGVAGAHGVTEGDQGYIQEISGTNIIPFMYLGAKHMVTGYDHLLFLIGVIFFLYRLADIGIYVTLFAIGHSSTLILGVYFDIAANAYLIDAIIGLSVAYKALDNMGAYQRWFGVQPNTKIAVLVFGLFHGFGLATKMQEFEISREGLLANLIAFNVGVEIGQLLALSRHFNRYEFLAANSIFLLPGIQRQHAIADCWVYAYRLSIGRLLDSLSGQ